MYIILALLGLDDGVKAIMTEAGKTDKLTCMVVDTKAVKDFCELVFNTAVRSNRIYHTAQVKVAVNRSTITILDLTDLEDVEPICYNYKDLMDIGGISWT